MMFNQILKMNKLFKEIINFKHHSQIHKILKKSKRYKKLQFRMNKMKII